MTVAYTATVRTSPRNVGSSATSVTLQSTSAATMILMTLIDEGKMAAGFTLKVCLCRRTTRQGVRKHLATSATTCRSSRDRHRKVRRTGQLRNGPLRELTERLQQQRYH